LEESRDLRVLRVPRGSRELVLKAIKGPRGMSGSRVDKESRAGKVTESRVCKAHKVLKAGKGRGPALPGVRVLKAGRGILAFKGPRVGKATEFRVRKDIRVTSVSKVPKVGKVLGRTEFKALRVIKPPRVRKDLRATRV